MDVRGVCVDSPHREGLEVGIQSCFGMEGGVENGGPVRRNITAVLIDSAVLE